MNVLFVCKWNRSRSKLAEAIFNKLNKNKSFTAKSGGLFPGVPISENTIKLGNKFGIKISKKQSGLSHKLLMWSDYIIIVADDVPTSIFKEVIKNDGKKVIHWKIKEMERISKKNREKNVLKIKEKIEDFLKKRHSS